MKIALIGYGKMGKAIEKIALERGHEIVCIIDQNNRDDFESAAFASADVAIEFTNPNAALDNISRAFKAGVKVVSGSTGWFENHIPEVEQWCEDGHTLFWSSNFSLGVSIFRAVNKYMARIMNNYPAYEVSMSETHHIHKMDAPSGTAITIAESIIEEMDRKESWTKAEVITPEGIKEKNTEIRPEELPITAIRDGEVFGIHTVNYTSEPDTISFTHEAHNRNGFALGAVFAAEYTATHKGLLSMDDLFPFLKD